MIGFLLHGSRHKEAIDTSLYDKYGLEFNSVNNWPYHLVIFVLHCNRGHLELISLCAGHASTKEPQPHDGITNKVTVISLQQTDCRIPMHIITVAAAQKMTTALIQGILRRDVSECLDSFCVAAAQKMTTALIQGILRRDVSECLASFCVAAAQDEFVGQKRI